MDVLGETFCIISYVIYRLGMDFSSVGYTEQIVFKNEVKENQIFHGIV